MYNSEGWKDLEKRLNKLVVDKERKHIIIGRDFNLRIGKLGGLEVNEEDTVRESKDKVVSNKGRNFVKWIQEKEWYILNEAREGDWEEEYTYVGTRGCTVIDYIIVNEKINEKSVEFRR